MAESLMIDILCPQWNGQRQLRHSIGHLPVDGRDIPLIVTLRQTDFGHAIRWHLLYPTYDENQVIPVLVFSQDVLTTTPGTNFTYTSNATWDNTSNQVECIGAGARGAIGASTATSGGGGGGGAYTQVIGFQFATPGTTTATCNVGNFSGTAGAAGGDTWVNDTAYPASGTNKVGAKGGAALASGTSSTGSAGGASGSAYTSGFTAPVVNSGGKGGNAGAAATRGGAGGGAGGPKGVGVSPADSTAAAVAGGAGANGNGGAGGPAGNGSGANASAGKDISGTAGAGGGGGGGNASPSTGGAGGNYGGGSGGGGRSTGTSGQPATGVIVFSWPIYPLQTAMSAKGFAPVLAH
jgi:hypothetical protein